MTSTVNKYDGEDIINFTVMGFIIGMIVYFIVIDNSWNIKEELGSAICEEEYGMDYESYYNEELKCKDKIVTDGYDGLKVIIHGEET